jgi:hypothetical protein
MMNVSNCVLKFNLRRSTTAHQLAALKASLAAKEVAYGPAHVEVATSLDILAAAESARGRAAEVGAVRR